MNTTFIMLLALVIFLGAGFGGSFVGGVIYGQNLAENAEDELSPRLGAGGQFPGGGQGQGASTGQRGQGRPGQGEGFAGAQGQGGASAARQGGGPDNASGGPGSVAGETARQGRPGGAPAVQTGAAGNSPEEAVVVRQTEGRQDVPERDRPGRATQNDPQGGETQPQGPSGSETATVQQTPASEGDPGEVGTRSASGRAGIIGAVLAVDDDALTLESPRGELAVTLSEATTIYEVSESGREALAVESRVQVGGSRSPEGGLAAQWVVIVPEGMENLFGLAGNPGVRQRGQAP